MLNIAKMTWKILEIQTEFANFPSCHEKMDESWSNVIQNSKEISRDLAKVFLVLHFQF
jgi:hypothetical protein